ncbi:MAG TPA: SDR family NAD(P)-dependent oxidoreductase [Kiritimatiellia bacterium]|nr:SDR family NAD(P)-dependent oxidoreductase [Kiritimatiellia bacterium]
MASDSTKKGARPVKKTAKQQGAVRSGAEPVAVVGMSCLFPKAGDLKAYWENILNKVDAITEVPSERWDADFYFDRDKKGRDKIYSRWGGFIDPVVFDPIKFSLPPNTLKSIDPAQLLSLEAVDRALRDTGYPQKPFDREHTSCIFGMAGGMGDLGMQYGVRSSLPMYLKDMPEELLRQFPEWTEDSFPGILPNVIAGRIANCFDLGGSNFTVDAACASGLTALYLGVRELVSHTANVAIVGACDVMQTPFGFLCFSKTQALTPSGKPKPFDHTGDGIVISEGLGVVVLKRLSDAERDGDRIYAVIRGVGSSSDGRGKSLTAPQAKGQMRAMHAAYNMAGSDIGPLELVEAHGTGTVLGDGTEAETILTAMREKSAPAKSCAVGSVKSQIGHTKGCAGMAGLIKTALALHHKVLPPTINVTQPAAQAFKDPASPVYVNTEPRPWIAGETPRRAGVNSFGFGGTNFHALMEEYQGAANAAPRFALETWPVELFVWTGDSHAALSERLGKTEVALAGKQPRLRDLASAVWRARGGGAMRLAIVADSTKDLAEKIAAARKHLAGKPDGVRDPRGIYFASAPLRHEGKIAFLFPGQGSQRPDMLRDLTVLFPELADRFALADRVLAKRLDRPLSRYVFPPPRFTPEQEQQAMTEITVTNIAQPALGAAEMGMFHVLARLGIAPEMKAGHSSGEYAALCSAGVFSEEALYEILEDRGSSILETSDGRDLGTMMAVKGSAAQVRELIASTPGVYVANFNSPSQTIISGLKPDLETAAKTLEAAGLKTRFIPVSCAFHSPIIEPARKRLARKLETVSYKAPRVPVYSNVAAEPYPSDSKKVLSLLAEHLIASVRFTEEIEAMYRDGARIFIECGPGNVLTGLTGQILEGRRHLAVATDAKSTRHDLAQLHQALAQLFADGVEFSLDAFFAGREINELDPATLAPVSAPPKQSAAAWIVAADRSWPVAQTRPVRTRISMAPVVAPAQPAATPAAAAVNPAAADVLVKYQRVMATFLEQQKEIMMAYLGGRAPGAALPDFPTLPSLSMPAPAVAPAAPAPARAAAPIPAPAAPAKPAGVDWNAKLVAMIAERTGYPAEMLEPDLNIESDLGIDSIKRLEILIAFAQEIPGAPEDLPEKLAAARTLREVLAKIEPYAPNAAAAKPASAPGASAPAPAVAAPAGDLTATLVAMVSERTGYPVEMLDLNLDVESDLGIDSIKRLEILIAFAQGIPGAAEDLPEKLSTARTLGKIIELAQATGGTAAAPAASTTAQAPTAIASNGTGRVHRTLIGLQKTPLSNVPKLAIPAGAILITNDGQGAADELRKALEAQGAKVALADAAQFDTPKRAETLIANLRKTHGTLGGVIHLLPLRDVAELTSFSRSAWTQVVREEIKGLYHLLRAGAPDLKNNADAWVLACASLGRRANNGSLPPPAFPWRGGLMGFLKSIADEWPKALSKVIDTDETAPGIIVPRLLQELATRGAGCEIYYRAQNRWVPRTFEQPLDRQVRRVELGPDDVVMIIGGARGITAEVAREIAQAHRPTLLLVGRSAWPLEESALTASLTAPADIKKALFTDRQQRGESVKPLDLERACQRILNDREMRATRADLERAGSKVFYYQADVQDESAVAAMLGRVYAEHGRLDGVINGAGIIEDKLIEDKTPESFDRVFDNKVESVFLLSRLLKTESLKFLVLFSSIAGWRGNRGQIDYAAANEVLNRMAMYLGEQWKKRVVAIDWGPWRTVGMASEGVQRQFKERGVGLIAPDAGRRFLLDEICYGESATAIVVAEGPLDD